MAELKASHEKAHATVLVGLILESVAAALSDPPFKYKKAAIPSPNYFPPSFLSIFPNTVTHSISSRRWHLQNPTW